jgi:hypothetical protein
MPIMRDFLFIFLKHFTIYLSCIVNKENICTHEPLFKFAIMWQCAVINKSCVYKAFQLTHTYERRRPRVMCIASW